MYDKYGEKGLKEGTDFNKRVKELINSGMGGFADAEELFSFFGFPFPGAHRYTNAFHSSNTLKATRPQRCPKRERRWVSIPSNFRRSL